MDVDRKNRPSMVCNNLPFFVNFQAIFVRRNKSAKDLSQRVIPVRSKRERDLFEKWIPDKSVRE